MKRLFVLADAIALTAVIVTVSMISIKDSSAQSDVDILNAAIFDTSKLVAGLPATSNRAIDLGGPVFPEYHNSPFSGWRTGSDEPAPNRLIPLGQSETIMELPADGSAVVKPEPNLETAPVVSPDAQPAADRIQVIYAPD